MADVGTRKPTEKEAFFFLAIIGAMKNKPDVDWELVAQRAGYNNANTAKVRFNQIKKAIGFAENGPMPAQTPASSSVKKEKSQKAQKNVGSGTNTTPSKVRKTPTKKLSKVAKHELEGLQAASNDFLGANAYDTFSVKQLAKVENDDEADCKEEVDYYFDPEDSSP